MANTVTAPKRDGYRSFVGWVLTIIGATMIIAGATAWFTVGSQLQAQNMTVPGDASLLAGKPVAGPLTAWSMQETIQKHANNATDGLTYAELGTVVDEAKAEFGDDSQEAADAQGLRNTQMNASFLRASLFTSILAYGVSLLVVGTGFALLLSGTVFVRRPKQNMMTLELESNIR